MRKSTDENPQHLLCSLDWCKYLRAKEEGIPYDHSKHIHLILACMEEMKPIFRDLSSPQLLEKCLHGKSQNPDESELGLKIGRNCVNAMKELDRERLRKAERMLQEVQKKSRQSRDKAKRKLEDLYESQEDPYSPSYGAVMH